MVDLIVTVNIPEDRRLVIDLPLDTPLGEVEVVIRPKGPQDHTITAGEVLASALFGYWRDRTDIPDSAAYITQLRRDEEARRNPWT